MAEHCTQLGLPVREDYIFVAKALSQVSQVVERVVARRLIDYVKNSKPPCAKATVSMYTALFD